MVPPWCHHAPFTIVCHHHFHSPLDHPTSPQLEVEGLAPGDAAIELLASLVQGPGVVHVQGVPWVQGEGEVQVQEEV